MSTNSAPEAHWDPYDYALMRDPHEAFRAIRERGPLYYNEEYDFYALTGYEDCIKGLSDRETFSNGKGVMIEQIRSGVAMPRGLFNFEDPPEHTIYRGLLSRVFTPGRMARLEPQIRAFCAEVLDPLVGVGRFDFVQDLGAIVPMQVIGMLLGIPEEERQTIRLRADARLRTEQGQPMQYDGDAVRRGFDTYVERRIAQPSDDIISQLVQAEFEDGTGAVRRLDRAELTTMIGFLASAGNETTNRLIGWAGKLFADHPDQLRAIHKDRSLIPQAIEELLRFEPPAAHIGRYVAKDVEIHGTLVPEGCGNDFPHRRRQPRPARVPRSRPLRYLPRAAAAPDFRLWPPRLPWQCPGADRRADCARRSAEPVRGVGGGPGQRAARLGIDGARMGDLAGGCDGVTYRFAAALCPWRTYCRIISTLAASK